MNSSSMSKTRTALDLHLRLAVFRRDSYTCQHCGLVGSYFSLEVDHVMPWSWDGPDEFENFQTLCGPCNRRKGARYVG